MFEYPLFELPRPFRFPLGTMCSWPDLLNINPDARVVVIVVGTWKDPNPPDGPRDERTLQYGDDPRLDRGDGYLLLPSDGGPFIHAAFNLGTFGRLHRLF